MTIRPATDHDISAIVTLLKLSLGEDLMPKTEAFWRWKHLDNPFGKSPVLLAFENEKLIGVRAFMRWEWRVGNKIFKAVRAVDTAVHPNHQGKGVFKKLTMQLVEQCQAEGVDFIFNTPNKSSLPGYLKMGWHKHGRMEIFVRPLLRLASTQKNYAGSEFRLPDLLLDGWNDFPASQMLTNRSLEFLDWRYAKSPNLNYHQFSDAESLGIYRLKPNRFGIEFRIVDLFSLGGNTPELRELIFQTAKASGANQITFSGHSFVVPSIKVAMGPTITIRHLSGDNSLPFGFWKPSLGDMEVF